MGMQILQAVPIWQNVYYSNRSPPLTLIFTVKDPSSRLLRWRLKLEEYEYEIVYKKDLTILMPINLAGNMFLRVTQTVMTINQG